MANLADTTTATAHDHVMGLIFGRWRSKILHAGVALGIAAYLSVSLCLCGLSADTCAL